MYDIFEKILEERGLTAYKVAKGSGLSTATLTNWKKGRYMPKLDKLQKIADCLGVSVDYLMGIEKTMIEPKDPTYGLKDNFALFANELQNLNMSQSELESLLDIAKIMKGNRKKE